MRIVLLGAPGSGKSIQARELEQRYRIPQIFTGDLLRASLREGGAISTEAGEVGLPVTDRVILDLLRERFLAVDLSRGFLLNGFPRTIAQAVALDELLAELGYPLDHVFFIDLDPDLLTERLVGRLTCESCGRVYNIFTDPPRVEELCDECGGPLHHRVDDNEETIATRLRVFDHQAAPLVTYYRTQGILSVLADAEKMSELLETLMAQQGVAKEPEAKRGIDAGPASAANTHAAGKTYEESVEEIAPADRKGRRPVKRAISTSKRVGSKQRGDKEVKKRTGRKKKAVSNKGAVKKSAKKRSLLAAKKSSTKKQGVSVTKTPAKKPTASGQRPAARRVKKTTAAKKTSAKKSSPSRPVSVTRKKSAKLSQKVIKKKLSGKKRPVKSVRSGDTRGKTVAKKKSAEPARTGNKKRIKK